ncbi:MAG: VCBS repeat-containing protein, partial [bacterium]
EEMAELALAKEIRFKLGIHQPDPQGQYSSSPDSALDLTFKTKQLGSRWFDPFLPCGDVNGDGATDLLVWRTPEEIQIYLGDPAKPGWNSKPAAKLEPGEASLLAVEDADGDGRDDIVLEDDKSRIIFFSR